MQKATRKRLRGRTNGTGTSRTKMARLLRSSDRSSCNHSVRGPPHPLRASCHPTL
jgi:hypothetical protein